ncbi:MAG: ribosome maturation factor RimP [Clostridia bacterium]|nr:ribosome maturation factor RimP [Clostridia bacterium]
MAKANIAAQVRELIAPTVEELGYSIWSVEYAKEGADWHLTVTIDSPDGIDIMDCETVHRAIEPLIDEADPIETFYYLNVSSPGIERELKCEEHILACIGERCEAKLFAAKNGTKTLRGTLSAYEGGKVTLSCEGGDVTLERTEISKLRTVYFD